MRHDYLVIGTARQPSSPGFVQRIGYVYGATLPESMSDSVRRDLTGPGGIWCVSRFRSSHGID